MASLLEMASQTHGKSMQSYLTMMAVRLVEMQRILKPTGSIYLHCTNPKPLSCKNTPPVIPV